MTDIYHRDEIPDDLRIYFVRAEIGLEPTPDEYIAEMVEVFREVRRVLRDDGTLFLNIGDSYMASGATFRGGFQRAVAYGNGDKELEGSQVHGCLCESLCDACRKAYRIGKSHSDSLPAPTLAASTHASSHEHTESQIGHSPTSGCLRQAARTEGATLDPAQDGCLEYEPPHGVLASTTLRCDAPHLVSSLEASSRGGECQLCGATFLRCALPSSDSSACTCGIGLRSAPSARGTSGMIFSDSAYVGLTTKSHIKPKDLIGIPWLLAFALRADGWYLRSEIIWHKPNPMPESVTDRPTKAHEQIFLLTKSPRYYYDAEAIKEPGTVAAGTKGAKGSAHRAATPGVNSRPPEYKIYDGTRNARSVWTIATKPYPEAHFATFPPDIPERCIKAGCPVGGTILDPFGGAGTTGLVADRLQRHAILIELNPQYAEMARRRIADDAGLLGVA